MRVLVTMLSMCSLLGGAATLASNPPPAVASNKATTATPATSASTAAVRDTLKTSAVDRLQLDATAITGNRELPKVMSIVPWKAAEPPAGPDRPMNSLIEELLTPVDREEFRREVGYYRDLTQSAAAPQGHAVAEKSPPVTKPDPSGAATP